MKLVTNNIDKVGRNEQCPCGSGKKYKRCCLLESDCPNLAEVDFDPANFKKDMEQMMKKIWKIAESKNFSAKDLNRFFVGKHMDDIDAEYDQIYQNRTPQDIAIDMVFDAMDMSSGPKRKKLLEEALKIYPHLPDAYIMLSQELAETPEEELSFFEKAVLAGETDLGKKFFKENEGYFWGMTESRPYMRAKLFMAQTLWELKREDEAITHYKDCIRLNPNDNQGVRDLLLPCLLVKNDLDGAEELLEKYKEDFGAAHNFNKAFFLFRKFGADSKKTATQLQKAIKGNSHVVKYLTGKNKIPKLLPDHYSYGSPEEAIIYTDEALRMWKEADGAIEWLSKF